MDNLRVTTDNDVCDVLTVFIFSKICHSYGLGVNYLKYLIIINRNVDNSCFAIIIKITKPLH